jgi:hypothetical protein
MTTHHRITAGIVTLGLAAAGAAPASAWQSNLNANGSEVPANEPALSQATPPSSPPTIVRVTARNSGFDWGDAGIGAAGGLALSMVGLGGALAVSQRRTRRATALSS